MLNQISLQQSSEIKEKYTVDVSKSPHNVQESTTKCDSFIDLLRRPTVGTRNLLKQISQPNTQLDVDSKKAVCASSGRQFLSSYKANSSSLTITKNDLAKVREKIIFGFFFMKLLLKAKAISTIRNKHGSVLVKEDPNNLHKSVPIKNLSIKASSVENILEGTLFRKVLQNFRSDHFL